MIVLATNQIHLYWYQHRHNLNKRWPDEGFGQQGPSEVRSFIDNMGKHVENYFFAGVGQEVESAKKIFSEEPHSTWDNHFSGKSSMFQNPIVILNYKSFFNTRTQLILSRGSHCELRGRKGIWLDIEQPP